MLVIAYEYESSNGNPIRKAVVCGNTKEYDKVKDRIKKCGYKLIEFRELVWASQIIHD